MNYHDRLINKINKTTFMALCAATLVVGCASAPTQTALLTQAEMATNSAEADPAVVQYAAVELETAQRLLAQSRAAARSHEEEEVIDHYAYLAKQTALTATARAKVGADEAILATGATERTRIQLQAREREVQQARAMTASEAARANRSEAEALRLQQDAERLSQEREQMAKELEQLKAKQTERGMVLTLGDVLFDTGKAELNPGAERTLDQLVEFLKSNSERKVRIEGFTDSVGSDDYNLQLSAKRAETVKSALISKGIEGARITTKGYGEAYAVASNDNASGKQLNRRVEVIIANDDGDVQAR